MTKVPYLGRTELFWHQEYNIPLLRKIRNTNTYRINLTPPGDVRPAFKKDIQYLREGVNQLINGAGRFFNYPVLLNNVPEIDRMDEVISDGFIIGKIRFNTDSWGFEFLPSPRGAKVLLGFLFSKYKDPNKVIRRTRHVIVDSLAAKNISMGKNVLAPGVIQFSKFNKGDYVYLFSGRNDFIGVGRALVSSDDLADLKKGTVIKRKIHYNELVSFNRVMESYRNIQLLREKLDHVIEKDYDESVSEDQDISKLYISEFDPWKLFPSEALKYWRFIIAMNIDYLRELERKAINFINGIAKQYKGRKYLVSFSGGKDSCVVLELIIRSNLDFCTLFIDTGIEMPETLHYVKNILSKLRRYFTDSVREEIVSDYKVSVSDHGIIVKVPNNRFWLGVKKLGYPGMDWRWCCKTNKLAPTRIAINEFLNEIKVSFGGIRRYESFQRSKEGKVSRNIWTGQINAYPIYEWRALETWLYVLWRRIPVNPLYGEGLMRIGCYPCPFSHMADFFILEKLHIDLINRIKNAIAGASSLKNIEFEKFFRKGSWRWLRPPKKIKCRTTLKRPATELIRTITQKSNVIEIDLTDHVDGLGAIRIIRILLRDKVREINLKKQDKNQIDNV